MGDPTPPRRTDPAADQSATTLSMPQEGDSDSLLTLVRVRDGGTGDLQALDSMMVLSPSYRLLTQRRLPLPREATTMYGALPAGAVPQDKFLWCAWQQQRLVGCIEVIRHWPVRDAAHIGLLQVADAVQRRGIGTQILQQARHHMRSWTGVRRLRLAVSANNDPALAFWRKAGFRETGQIDRRSDFVAALLVMERPLA